MKDVELLYSYRTTRRREVEKCVKALMKAPRTIRGRLGNHIKTWIRKTKANWMASITLYFLAISIWELTVNQCDVPRRRRHLFVTGSRTFPGGHGLSTFIFLHLPVAGFHSFPGGHGFT
jgi:hypothetical protein